MNPSTASTLPDTTSYHDHLHTLGLAPETSGVWLKVGRTGRVQGWKLHVSSVPAEAHALLDAIVPILRTSGVPFKIARDATILGLLNEGNLGATQVGKFCTIYPLDDAGASALAAQLAEATKGFNGPVITSDMALGNLVYARYGGFNTIVERDLLGQHHLYIRDGAGELIADAYTQPFVAPSFAACPFAVAGTQPAAGAIPAGPALIGPGYLLVDVIKQHAKGNVYLAILASSQQAVGGRVIKEGRKHCLSDIHGRDIRVRLQRQGEIHARLDGVVPVPACDAYFEVDGDGYLPMTYIPGADLESVVQAALKRGPWHALERAGQQRLLGALRQLADAVARLHDAGFVHRDLSVSNVWLGGDGRTWLLDLEIAQHVGDHRPVFGKGTPGFMAPEQEAGAAPTFAQDIHAVAALILFVLTGLDPRRTLFARGESRARNVRHLAASVPDALLDVVLAGVDDDPLARPTLAAIGAQLAAYEAMLHAGAALDASAPPAPAIDFAACARSAGSGMLHHAFRDPKSGLWLSASISSGGGQEQASSYELRRGANRGVAGAVYALARLHRAGMAPVESAAALKQAVDWLLSSAVTPDQGMPGLHFGDAGVAVGIAEAARAGLLPLTARIVDFMAGVFDAPVVWPDLTHGAAGQGLAAIMCADSLCIDAPLAMAQRCARYLVDTQAPDGSWVMPEGVPGMSGETLSGFAHGVAGMVFFLLEHGARFDDDGSRAGAARGLRWMQDHALAADDAAAVEWRYSDRQGAVWHWWCHGAPGIALTFLRAYRLTQDPALALLARRALDAIDPHLRAPNLTVCHGLAGIGEILLEGACALDEPAYRDKAAALAATIVHLGHRCADGSMVWLAEDPVAPTADLMVGMGGIAHFLARLGDGGEGLGFPLMP